MLEITEVKQEEDLLEIKKLFEEYAGTLEINLDFQGFEEELAGLPGEYAPPSGGNFFLGIDSLINLYNDGRI